jgi:hypothetical protein
VLSGIDARVCIATVTWARDEHEQLLLRESLDLLANFGLPIAVADRGSGETFAAFLASRPQFKVAAPLGPSLVGQVLGSLTVAADTGAEFILYTESDKALFFKDGLESFIRSAGLRRRTGAVLAARSDGSFSTFPSIQQFTERTINELTGQFIGKPGDYSYGPFLLNRDLVPHLATIAPAVGWGWRHFAFGCAARLGYEVDHISGPYPCPSDQRVETDADRLHRIRQLAQNVQGLLLAMDPELRP